MTTALRLYLAGQLASVACSWAQVVALSVVAVRIDPALLGWVVAAQFLPSLLLGPWFGVVADRYDRRVLLIGAEAGLGLVAVGYATAQACDALDRPVLLGAATAWGILNALDTPARQALLPSLAPGAAVRLPALTGVVLLTGMTTGSALGGWLVATAGPMWVFVLNAGSFAADVVVLHRVGRLVGAPPRAVRARGQLREGLRYVLVTPPLRTSMLALAVIGTFAMTFPVSVPLLATGTFAGDPAFVGTAIATVTGGSLAGAAGMAVKAPRRNLGGVAALALAMSSAGVAAAPGPFFALAGLALVGVTWSIYLTSTIAVLQTADPRFLGRVMALFGVLLVGSNPIGGPIAAALAEAAGPRAPFVLGAAAAGAGWLLLGKWYWHP
ncbi:MFS transporter [Amycolatopsis jejuensis]|uniref:MFS transporter n=1 Tax=Amycolatopsis jejuensis TaxID=330084 RepID=UPI00068AEB9B|nr:MFS transporter [Amycolatopsis jejuensis]